MKKSEKWKKMGWQHCFCQLITRFSVLSVKFIKWVGIGVIDWLSGTMGEIGYKILVTESKVGIGYPVTSVPDPNIQIKSYRHWLPSVTECPQG